VIFGSSADFWSDVLSAGVVFDDALCGSRWVVGIFAFTAVCIRYGGVPKEAGEGERRVSNGRTGLPVHHRHEAQRGPAALSELLCG
jgi:hypothetical protein